jgi:hypothetical protein
MLCIARIKSPAVFVTLRLSKQAYRASSSDRAHHGINRQPRCRECHGVEHSELGRSPKNLALASILATDLPSSRLNFGLLFRTCYETKSMSELAYQFHHMLRFEGCEHMSTVCQRSFLTFWTALSMTTNACGFKSPFVILDR